MAEKLLSLAPLDDLDPKTTSLKPYCEFLDGIYEDPRLRNVGVIGSKGSGKSSILHTYDRQKHRGEDRFLFVSLIDFEASKDPAHNEETKKRLEHSLLCQILARCTGEDLRGTSLVGIPEPLPSTREVPRYLTWLTVIGLLLAFHSSWEQVMTAAGAPPAAGQVVYWLLCMVMTATLCIGLHWSLRNLLPRIRLKQFSVKSSHTQTDIELENTVPSLDQHKFEIIHVLSRIADRIGHTVVFEDMERLEGSVCVEIMTKLREINTLLNTHRSIRTPEAKPIRFLYVLSDTVFDKENRTKFFDIIMPVLPAMNGTNAEDLLVTLLLKYAVPVDELNLRQLIADLGFEVDNYRTARDIVNEFLLLRAVYRDNHQRSISPAAHYSLLELAAAKVLHPQAYAVFIGNERVEDPEEELMLEEKLEEFSRVFTKSEIKHLFLSEDKLSNDRLDTLQNGSRPAKVEMICAMIRTSDGRLKDRIHAMQLLLSEQDPDVAQYMGEYLFTSPEEIFDKYCDLRKWNRNTYHDADTHQTIELPPKSAHSVINVLLCLSYFTTEQIRNALTPDRSKIVSAWLLEQLALYDFEGLPTEGRYGNITFRGKLWSCSLSSVLTVCLEDIIDQIPEELLSKKMGDHPLSTYLKNEAPAK